MLFVSSEPFRCGTEIIGLDCCDAFACGHGAQTRPVRRINIRIRQRVIALAPPFCELLAGGAGQRPETSTNHANREFVRLQMLTGGRQCSSGASCPDRTHSMERKESDLFPGSERTSKGNRTHALKFRCRPLWPPTSQSSNREC